MTTPKIYTVCLSAYSNGLSHGKWINCDRDSDEIMVDIKAMLSRSPMSKIQACEEWAIHAHEGFEGITIGEYEPIDQIVEMALKLKEHGEVFAAFLEFWSFENIGKFEDSYQGCYKSEEDFAEEYYQQDGIIEKIEAAGLLRIYIDFEAIARDMFVNNYVGISKGAETIYVFSRF